MKELSVEVEFENVSKSFGIVEALRDVSFQVRKSEFFSILGPSGCGKTTLLRILAGLEDADRGVVRIGGRVVNNIPPDKRGVGLIFQGTAVFPHMNVFDNIAFGLRMKGHNKNEIRERVERILHIMNMPPEIYSHKRVDQLSGGERQRIEIARSLVLEPKVLLLDEPLGPLDLKIRQKMQFELKRLQRIVGSTFIYVTHDQTEALSMSDRIAVMNRGEVMQVGTPEEIYSSPANKFVADFIGEANLIEGVVSQDGRFEADGLPPLVIDQVGERIFKPGERALLPIRPEKIHLGDLPELENRLVGVAIDKTYTGPYVSLRIEVSGKMMFTVYVNDLDLARKVELGSTLVFGWRAKDTVLVGL